MTTSENNDKVLPERRPTYRAATLFALLVLALQFIIAIVSYPFLPASVPSHWDASGQVNGHMPRLMAAFFTPVLSLLIYLLVRGLVALGPSLGRRNQQVTQEVVNLLLAGILLFMLVVQVITTALALGISLNINLIMGMTLSVFMIFLGNYLGKLPRNFWAGIRTPWTLSSDSVWERTHRVGGWLFVAAGALGIPASLIPGIGIWGIFGLIMAAALISVIYSYIVYQQVQKRGRDPLSPPFSQSED